MFTYRIFKKESEKGSVSIGLLGFIIYTSYQEKNIINKNI
ncbi:hypothetical protein LMG9446_2323 [Lactococcus lactis subsp. lactis]|nr:hypothetical protein LMG9446_2323 [Lactococcus lactis subsp. lactis]KSU10750.1 hypothetical protein LMG8526_1823 [Lactococcus lactis subsp. lactis]